MSIKAVMMNSKDNVATMLSEAAVGAVVVVTSADGNIVKRAEWRGQYLSVTR